MAKGNRTWTLPPENELPEGWFPDTGEPIAVIQGGAEPEMFGELEQEMQNAAWVLRRFGGIFTAAAHRKEIAPGMYLSNGYILTWDSFSPAQRLDEKPAPAPAAAPAPDELTDLAEPEPEPEPTPVPASPTTGDRSVPPSPTLAGDEEVPEDPSFAGVFPSAEPAAV